MAEKVINNFIDTNSQIPPLFKIKFKRGFVSSPFPDSKMTKVEIKSIKQITKRIVPSRLIFPVPDIASFIFIIPSKLEKSCLYFTYY